MPVSTVLGPNGVAVAVVDDDTKVDIRRYCGYAAYGPGASNYFELGVFLDNYRQLELRMNVLTVSEYARVTYILNYIQQIEDLLFGMQTALIVEQAAVFHRNMNETSDRHAEFCWWLRHLVNFLGILPGPKFEGGLGQGNTMRFIK